MDLQNDKQNDPMDSEVCMESEKCLENESINGREYPEYSYRNRVNFLYTQITNDRNKTYQCILCNFETCYLHSIRKHFMRHTNSRPYNCQKCSHTSRTKGNLKRHILYSCGKRKFTGIGQNKCHLCDYCTPRK